MWWFGMPAILKGWVDRVLAYGFAYGGEYGMKESGRFKGRLARICMTTGSPENFYSASGTHKREIADILRNINEGILGLIGFETGDAFVAFNVSRVSTDDRAKVIDNYKKYLQDLLA